MVAQISYEGSERTFTTALCSPHDFDENSQLNSHCETDEVLTDSSGKQYDFCCDNASGLVLNRRYVPERYVLFERCYLSN